MTVIAFPTKVCAMCERLATQTIDLVDEYGNSAGQKHMCGDYPYCTDPNLMDDLNQQKRTD